MILLTGLIGTVMVTGLLGCAIAGAYFLGRSRGSGRALEREAGPSEARLVRIESLLETLSIDIERIGEAQRYAARDFAHLTESARLSETPESREPPH